MYLKKNDDDVRKDGNGVLGHHERLREVRGRRLEHHEECRNPTLRQV